MRGTGRIFKRPNSSLLWISYCHTGKEFRESSGSTDRKVAERLLKQRLREIGADVMGLRAFVGPQQDRLTVGDLLRALESDFQLRELKSLKQTLGHLRIVRDALGDLRARAVSAETVSRYIKKCLAGGHSPATVNRRTTLLGEAFRLAIRRRQLSSMPEIPKLRETNIRSGFFEKADFGAMMGCLPDYLKRFAHFGFLTGWRKGEIASLAWGDVDLLEKVIRLRPENSKNGQSRVLALEGELLQIIERQWKLREYPRPDGTVAFSLQVFHRNGARIGDIRKSWGAACKKAGLQGRLFHDLRRSAIRNMIRGGVTENTAMKISGHKTASVFRRYDIINLEDVRQAVLKTQAYLDAAPSKSTVAVFPETATGTRQ